ncbi:MAG TPA: hypothetical protein VJ902_05730, partial [Wenzhouxiangellaceae bacterium]|nr:hypothetical protein [Wenzhouxiangellaceae bacterium]
GLFVPWVWVLAHGLDPHLLSGLWPAAWPLGLAAALVWLKGGLAPRWRPGLPAGDMVVWMEGAARLAGKGLARLARAGAAPMPNLYPVHVRMTRTLLWMERKITALPVAGLLILGLGGLLWLVARWS